MNEYVVQMEATLNTIKDSLPEEERKAIDGALDYYSKEIAKEIKDWSRDNQTMFYSLFNIAFAKVIGIEIE
jgi:hypothetical protein